MSSCSSGLYHITLNKLQLCFFFLFSLPLFSGIEYSLMKEVRTHRALHSNEYLDYWEGKKGDFLNYSKVNSLYEQLLAKL